MMVGYTKLSSAIVTSTVWRECPETRVVWITMLALADQHGEVAASVPGLADVARVSVEACRAALERLSAPDPDSRTPDFEGRRIERIDGGWVILNHAKYRELQSKEHRDALNRERQARHRRRQAGRNAIVTRDALPVRDNNAKQKQKADTEANAESRTAEEAAAAELSGAFLSEPHLKAYLEFRRAHRNPAAFDAGLKAVNRPPNGARGFDWSTIGAALLDMAAAEVGFTPNALRGFCRRVSVPSEGDGTSSALMVSILNSEGHADAIANT